MPFTRPKKDFHRWRRWIAIFPTYLGQENGRRVYARPSEVYEWRYSEKMNLGGYRHIIERRRVGAGEDFIPAEHVPSSD